MGGRTDDHEYRGSHHQTPGTLQGGRTDAQTVRDFCTRAGGSPAEARNALDRLEARLVAAEEREEQALKGAMAWESAAAKAAERLVAVEDALRDEIEMADQALEELRAWQVNWKTWIDQDNPDGEPLIVEMLRSVIDDITPSAEARAALAAAADTGQGAEARLPAELDPADGA